MRTDDLKFLISLLNLKDREEFYKRFGDYVPGLSRTARYRLARGEIHLSDDRILKVVSSYETARNWLIMKAKEKCKRVSEISSVHQKVNVEKSA